MIVVEKDFIDDAWDYLDRLRGDKLIHDFGINDDESFWISPMSSEDAVQVQLNDIIKYGKSK